MVRLYKEQIIQAKALPTIRKRFLSDVMTNRSNLTPQTLGSLVSKIDRYGKKDLIKLFNQIIPILYGETKNNSIKKEKAERLGNVFPFAEDIIEPMNTSLEMFTPKKSTMNFKNVAESIEFDLKNKKFDSIPAFESLAKRIEPSVFGEMNRLYKKLGAFKIIYSIEVWMRKENPLDEDEVRTPVLFNSGSVQNNDFSIILNNKFNNSFDSAIEKLKKEMEEFLRNGSDWVFDSFSKFIIRVVKYNAFHGSSYIELPSWINNKKCCVNIKNDDNKCFMYSVLCGMHYDEIKDNHQRTTKYKQYENELKFDDIEFPVKIDDINKFEEQNNIPINIFMINEEYDKENEVSQHFKPMYLHKVKNEKKPINLLLIEDEDKSHYVYIKNIRAFIRCKNTENLFVCDKCFKVFREKSAFENHIKHNKCEEALKVQKKLPQAEKYNNKTKKLEKDNHVVKYKTTKKQLPVPFAIYADGESILNKVNPDKSKNTQIYQNHQVYNLGCKFVSEFPDEINDEYKEFTGDNCMIDFLNYVFEMKDKVMAIVDSKNQAKMIMTNEDNNNYNNSNICHICNNKINGEKVRDHCHITGKFRGASCNKCNLDYNYKNFKLPVIFHNLKGYDSHFILQYVGQMNKGEISVIPNTMEKYMSFTIDNCIFLDSVQFLNASLESLVEALNKSKDENLFKHFNDGYKSSSQELKDLLRQKGVFPYDWYDNKSKLNYIGLPTQDNFYNELNECGIDEKDYERALKVYELSKCQNFGNYLSLYLKCDVLLLADVFEAFRVMCLKNYGLDPCHYFTSPGFSWDAMLKMTGANIECFKEGQEDMLEMIENNMRGGISMISNRYAKANNKYMKSYNPNEPSSYILYEDANNLYGWAMSQLLPTGNYNWENANEWDVEKVMKIIESKIGFIFDVDLNVPEELHDYFNDYPLAPESRLGEFSEHMKNKYFIINGKEPKSTVPKLIPNLYNKKNYVLHYKNLQLYISLGMKLININRVLSFTQENFLEKYIDFNTKKRAMTKNDYEKDLFKLMNNSVFGKTMENVSKRIDVKLMTDEKKFVKKCSMPNFKDFRIFSEGLAAVEMGKTEVLYNRPMIVGFCILELSKVLMYNFHYNTIKKQYGDKAKLLFTDTDSLCYHIETDDIYEDMKNNLNMYDTSDYPKDHKCYSEVNKKVIGKMKDEANSKPIIEFCGHRAKMYSFLTEEYKEEWKGPGKSVAKGIKKNQIKKLKMEEFKRALFGTTKKELEHKVSFNLLRSSNHQMNSVRITKTGLSAIDDKRYVLNNNINTYAHGHYKINNI